MKNIKWFYYLDILLLTISAYLLIQKLNIYFSTGKIDYLRAGINAVFLIYIFIKVVQHKKSV